MGLAFHFVCVFRHVVSADGVAREECLSAVWIWSFREVGVGEMTAGFF